MDFSYPDSTGRIWIIVRNSVTAWVSWDVCIQGKLDGLAYTETGLVCSLKYRSRDTYRRSIIEIKI